MSMLHIVNKSPFDRNSLDSCLRIAGPGSAVLLIEDGVYGAQKGTANSAKVEGAMAKVKVYALGPDLDARGIQNVVLDGVTVVDFGGFVDLVTQHDNVQSWL